MRVYGGGCQLQPLLLDGVPRFILPLSCLRLLELNRRDEPQLGKLLVGFRLQARADELRFRRGERCALLQEVALHFHPAIAVARFRSVEVQPGFKRHLLQLGVAQLDDDGVGGDGGSRSNHDPFDVAVGGRRDPPDSLRHERAYPPHLPDQRSALDGVEIDGVAVDPWRRRLQA